MFNPNEMTKFWIIVTFFISCEFNTIHGQFLTQNSCDSEIYCYGNLLHTVQMAKIYNDSKTFVDMKLRQSPAITLSKFNSFIAENATPSTTQIQAWVEENFEPRGTEFENWQPTDWVQSPAFLENIKDANFKNFASDLNALWLQLGRKMKNEVKDNSDLYSIIYVKNPVIVPGGRFVEFYYWDSFWIVRGLLLSEMYSTVKGMLENFLDIINEFGFIPNGGRIYYAMRSQPPLLPKMIKTYVDTTKDVDFAKSAAATLDKEFEFFWKNHTTTVNGRTLAYYGDKSLGPRPESYSEDVDLAERLSGSDVENLYSEIKAAAESGMDFSSRWFIDAEGTNNGSLKDLKTRSIIPVDLNALLYRNAKIIAEFYGLAGNAIKVAEYEARAAEIFESIQTVLWNDTVGVWLDYDMLNNKHRNYFVATNLAPLWLNCFDQNNAEAIGKKVLAYIDAQGLDNYPGGVPNTLASTNEQWDFPNVWPPMQYLLVWGLDNLPNADAKTLAEKWAQRWVLSNYKAYAETGHMYEKYDAEVVGGHGGGGEYGVQLGFGWSNGAVMDFMDKYGDSLSSKGALSVIPNQLLQLSLLPTILAFIMKTIKW